jgi:hypothetical protein
MPQTSAQGKTNFKKIFLIGLLVGSFDCIAAFIDAWLSSHTTPDRVLKYIASAALGNEALPGGLPVALLGLAFHFFIALSFTFLFYFAHPYLKRIFRYKLLIGFFYGLFVWSFMRFIVLPFTMLHLQPVLPAKAIKAILILVVAMGLPLAYLVPGTGRHKKTNSSRRKKS